MLYATARLRRGMNVAPPIITCVQLQLRHSSFAVRLFNHNYDNAAPFPSCAIWGLIFLQGIYVVFEQMHHIHILEHHILASITAR